MKTVPVGSSATDPEAGHREERWFLIRLAIVFAVILVGIFFLLGLRSQKQLLATSRVKLDDGRYLAVRAITVGTNHSIEIPYPINVRVNSGTRSYVKSAKTPSDRMMIWLTHEDTSGNFFDLNWFGRCELRTADGEIIKPKEYRLDRLQKFGKGEITAGVEGFPNAMSFGYGTGPAQMTTVRFDVPLIRPQDGKLRLVVFDGLQTEVTQLTIPYPPLPNLSTEQWQPDPLPATKIDGNVSVTLKSVNMVHYYDQRGTQVDPQLEFTCDGQPSTTWTATCELQDLLGNTSLPSNCELSPHEPAWKLKLTMFQTPAGQLRPEESLKLPARTLIPAKQFLAVSETHTVNGAAVSLVGLGGQGPMEFSLLGTMTRFMTHRYQRKQSNSEVTTDSTGVRTLVQLASGHAFLITRNAGNPQMNIQFVIRDQAGEVLPQRGKCEAEGFDFLFFEPLPTSTSFEIEIIAQKCHHAEFLIQPPKPEAPHRKK